MGIKSIGETVYHGRIISIRKCREVTFADLATKDGVVQLVVCDEKLRTGIQKHGYYAVLALNEQESQTKSELCRQNSNLIVKEISCIAIPDKEYKYRINKGNEHLDRIIQQTFFLRTPEHRKILIARNSSFSACIDYLRTQDFLRIFPPLIRGYEAVKGNTKPFTVEIATGRCFLPVSNMDVIRTIAIENKTPVFSVSPLFWNYRYNNKLSTNEFLLVEWGNPSAEFDDIIFVTEELVKVLVKLWSQEIREPYYLSRLHACLKDGIPRITYQDALKLLQKNGVIDSDKQPHEISASLDKVICKSLSSPIYWVEKSPSQTVPNYVCISQDGTAMDCELRIVGCGAVASGSVWQDDPVDKLNTCRNYIDCPNRKTYRGNGAGMTLGIDRLVRGLASQSRVESLTLFPRTWKWKPVGLGVIPTRYCSYRRGTRKWWDKNRIVNPMSVLNKSIFISPKANIVLDNIRNTLKIAGLQEFFSPYLAGSDDLLFGTLKPSMSVQYFNKLVGLRSSHIPFLLIAAAHDWYDLFDISPLFKSSNGSPLCRLTLTAIWRLDAFDNNMSLFQLNRVKWWLEMIEQNLAGTEKLTVNSLDHTFPYFFLNGIGQRIKPLALCWRSTTLGYFGNLVNDYHEAKQSILNCLGSKAIGLMSNYLTLLRTGIPPLGCLTLDLGPLLQFENQVPQYQEFCL